MKLASRGIANSSKSGIKSNLICFPQQLGHEVDAIKAVVWVSQLVVWVSQLINILQNVNTMCGNSWLRAETVSNRSRSRVLEIEVALCCCQPYCDTSWTLHCHECCSSKEDMDRTNRRMLTIVHSL